MARQEFTRPDTENPMYQRLWANLDKKQRKWLVRYNRIPVYGEDGILYVIPYSRFHNRQLVGDSKYSHVSVQEFWEIGGVHKFHNLRCGGLWKEEAAVNVLGIKLLLDTQPQAYTRRSLRLGRDYYGEFERGMTLEETYNVVVDGVRLLGESC